MKMKYLFWLTPKSPGGYILSSSALFKWTGHHQARCSSTICNIQKTLVKTSSPLSIKSRNIFLPKGKRVLTQKQTFRTQGVLGCVQSCPKSGVCAIELIPVEFHKKFSCTTLKKYHHLGPQSIESRVPHQRLNLRERNLLNRELSLSAKAIVDASPQNIQPYLHLCRFDKPIGRLYL